MCREGSNEKCIEAPYFRAASSTGNTGKPKCCDMHSAILSSSGESSGFIVITEDRARFVPSLNSLRRRIPLINISGGTDFNPVEDILKRLIFPSPPRQRSTTTTRSASTSIALSATPSRLIFPRLTRTTSGIELTKSRQNVRILPVGLREVVNNITASQPHQRTVTRKAFALLFFSGF